MAGILTSSIECIVSGGVDMSVEEYLQTLGEQIRCKQAREGVTEEVKNHIEDQIEALKHQGKNEEEAKQLAIAEMGDPVETGISLDRIHRPQIAWSMLLLIGILGILGTLVQMGISRQYEGITSFDLPTHLVYHLIGILFMSVMYYLDYTFWGTFGKVFAVAFLLFYAWQVLLSGGTMINGAVVSWHIAGMNFNLRIGMLLYIPMFAGVLYSYRGQKGRVWLKIAFFVLAPVWIALNIPGISLALLLFLTLMLMVSVAILKGWFFEIQKGKKIVAALWFLMAAAPPFVILAGEKLGLLADYQLERIRVLVGRVAGDPQGSSYVDVNVKKIISQSQWMSSGNGKMDLSKILPEVNHDFILTHIISYYGIFAGLLVAALLFFLVYKIFHISIRQKNQLGLMLGVGCGSGLGLYIFCYVLENLGILPYSYCYLPFFSQGGTGILVTYGILGIVLSVYKYRNIPLKVKSKNIIIKI